MHDYLPVLDGYEREPDPRPSVGHRHIYHHHLEQLHVIQQFHQHHPHVHGNSVPVGVFNVSEAGRESMPANQCGLMISNAAFQIDSDDDDEEYEDVEGDDEDGVDPGESGSSVVEEEDVDLSGAEEVGYIVDVSSEAGPASRDAPPEPEPEAEAEGAEAESRPTGEQDRSTDSSS